MAKKKKNATTIQSIKGHQILRNSKKRTQCHISASKVNLLALGPSMNREHTRLPKDAFSTHMG